ncbi:MAG: SLC26A/SulP transporter family protein [Rubrivivax sp.]|nr:SLC26A/SulP transporter family protein [Rubrivivax sp.]
MPTRPAHATLPSPGVVGREYLAGAAGTLISLAPALTMGLLSFAALGPQASALGIPAALVSSAVGGAVFALLARGPMAAGGPAAAPVLVLASLVARVAADPAFAAGDPAAVALLLALVTVAVVSMGLFQIALGLSGLVRFAKFVPQPVLGGFMNGVALLALLALLPLLLGWPVGALQAGGWRAVPAVQPATLVVGLFTVAVILGLPRLSPRLPANLIGLVAGTGVYALLHAAAPQLTLGPLTGALPTAWPQLDALSPFFNGVDDALLQRHGLAALTTGLVMALIGTLDLVLNGLALDQACHTRTDPQREVLALGVANVASGLAGGLPLLLLRPRALHMLQMGGRTRRALLFCCALFAVLGGVATPLLSLLPQVVLGGVMVTIAFLMADRWSLQLLAQWWRGPRTADLQLALAVVGVVCAITVVLGFPSAVAAGALLSVLLFVRSMNRSLVRNHCTGEVLPSRRVYAATDEARLQPLRKRITVLELEGALFFGSADRLAALADELGAACHTLVLDFRRVSLIDASGAVLLTQMSRRLHGQGIGLLLAGVSVDNRHGRVLLPFAGESYVASHGVADTDQAVELAELRLLAQAGFEPLRETVPLEQVSLMAGLDAAQRRHLAGCLQPRRLAPGEHLFRQGDPGDRLYVITAGSVNVFSVPAPGSAALRQRFVSLSPGMMLGETAMLDGGGRSGDAVADGETEVHALDDATLRQLRAEDPLLYAQIHRNIALHLSQRLRAAASAWRASMG